MLKQWFDYLDKPIAAYNLAAFRIAFGLIMLVGVGREFVSGSIASKYIDPQFLFNYLPLIDRWPDRGMYAHFAVMGVLALLIAVGLYYRLAAGLFFVAVTYVFLLDKAHYLNHMYLVCLISFLMVLLPADRIWSLDKLRQSQSKQGETQQDSVPRWSLWILRAQICIVYFYGGLAKLNPDWLSGQPQSLWMQQKSSYPLLGPYLGEPWFITLLTVGGILFDLTAPFMLLNRKTFWLAASLSTGFHLTNAYLFRIGIFPWFMLATLLLFVPVKWFRSLPFTSTTSIGIKYDTTIHNNVPSRSSRNYFVIGFLHVYLTAQLLLPFRHFLYPGDVDWTEEGHYFSWRMMLHHKDAVFRMYETDPDTGKKNKVIVRDYLTKRQVKKMSTHPEMMLQFAHWYANQKQQKTGIRPKITAEALVSLNSGRWYKLVDPEVDLASQPDNLLPKKWILPLPKERHVRWLETE